MSRLILISLVFLLGCASAKQVKGPNGEAAYLVQCGNAVKEKCNDKANEICPNGYKLLDRNANQYDDLTKVGNIGALEIKADTTTTMLVQCK
jgi:hypothetical protein